MEADAVFGEAIKKTDHFVVAMIGSKGGGREQEWPPGLEGKVPPVKGLPEYLWSGNGSEARMLEASFPVPEIGQGAKFLGHVRSAPSRILIFHDLPFIVFKDRFIPSLGLATYLAGNPEAKLEISQNEVLVDGKAIPLADDGRVVLRFRGPSQTHKTYPGALVMNSSMQMEKGKTPQLDPAVFKDKYVFLGVFRRRPCRSVARANGLPGRPRNARHISG